MKLLYVIDSLGGRGAEKLTSDLSIIISKRHKCEVLILTNKDDKYSDLLKSAGINVNIVPYNNHFSRALFIKRYIDKGKFDVVHANLFPVTYYCAISKMLCFNKRYKLVMTEHSTDNRRRHHKSLRNLEKLIYNQYDHIISISEQTEEKLTDWIRPKDKARFSVVLNGIHLDMYTNAVPIERTNIIANYKPGDVLICMVGSFAPPKNHAFMIKVLSQLPENYKLVCLGDGPLRTDVEELIANYKLKNRVSLLGFRRDVASIIKASNVMVIPSIWEGFGLIAAEGMACGIPIICSDIPGLSMTVGDNAIKCEVNNVKSFVEALLNPKKWRSGDEIIKQAQKYDIYHTASQYETIYKELLK